ncbi:MAG: hypothetical protein IT356_08255 [Gemmatimonadaceae bacterium]|nr:hypothetical protein [Gemmatimonadaceae bacterium]
MIAQALAVVAGWLVILLTIGGVTLAFAPDNLETVADTIERRYGTAVVAGLAGQAAFAPFLVALAVALALTILGILLIPFAIVVYVVIAAGLATLGYHAAAVVVGRGWRASHAPTVQARRTATLRALIVGNVVLAVPWLAASLLAAWPLAESLARGIAAAITWVACTVGVGAALVSRAGIARARTVRAERAMESHSWQTPTPVSGVAAARRPTATASRDER